MNNRFSILIHIINKRNINIMWPGFFMSLNPDDIDHYEVSIRYRPSSPIIWENVGNKAHHNYTNLLLRKTFQIQVRAVLKDTLDLQGCEVVEGYIKLLSDWSFVYKDYFDTEDDIQRGQLEFDY